MAYSPYTQRKNKGALARMIDAYSEGKVAKYKTDTKLRAEIEKIKLQSQVRGKEEVGKRKMDMLTPDKLYLLRRFKEENPLADVKIPEEGDTSSTIEFPATKVEPGADGKLREKTLSEKQKQMMFMTVYDKMKAAGKKPSPLADKIYDKYYRKANPEPKSSEYKPNSATQDFLDGLADEVSSGKIKTRDEAKDAVIKNGQQLGLKGADVSYIYKKIDEFLPDAPTEKQKQKGMFAKLGDAIYKKIKGGWKLEKDEDGEIAE